MAVTVINCIDLAKISNSRPPTNEADYQSGVRVRGRKKNPVNVFLKSNYLGSKHYFRKTKPRTSAQKKEVAHENVHRKHFSNI